MNETNIKSQELKAKISKIAVWSMVFGLMGPCSIVVTMIVDLLLLWLFNCRLGITGSVILFAYGPAWILGLAFGIKSLRKINNSNGQLLGKRYAITGISTSLVVMFTVLFTVFVPALLEARRLAKSVACRENLSIIGKAIHIYSNDNDGKYPIANNWCDLLIEGDYVIEGQFRCPANNKERCSYAINQDAKLNSPNDVILLFETKGGWNQFGGVELSTTENHTNGYCSILFNDGHVEIVKPEEIGQLKWKVEESNSNSN